MNYPLVALKDCCEVVGGATPKRNVPEYWGNDIPWVTPKDVSNMSEPVLNDAPEYISRVGYDSCSTYLLPKDAILLTSRAPIGNVAIAGREMCTNQGFKSLIPGKGVDSLYLYYCIKNNAAKLQNLGNGATFKEVSKKIVESFEIPLPLLKEQRRIAAILDKADAIRRKRQRAIELTEAFLRSVFLDMFGDPVTNPKRWGKEKFGEVTSSRLGKMLDAKQQTGKFLRSYLRNTNVQWGNFDLGVMLQMDFKEKDQVEYKLNYGDVLICEGGEVGRTAIWKNEIEDCYFQKALHRVRPVIGKITSYYILHMMWFLSMHGGLKDHTTSATIAHLTGVKLKNIKIPVPPFDLQEKFDLICEQHELALACECNIFEFNDQLLNSLKQQAFKGELTQPSTPLEEAISA